jgi:hypothetical protein
MSDDTEQVDAPTDKLVSVYIKMRDARSKLKQEYEEKDKAIKAQMEVLETHLLETCKKAGADSIRTQFGTVIRGVKTQYWTSDWENMHKFVLENQAVDLLERRVSQTAMKEFLQANPDKFPPGLNVNSEYTVTVRRSK